MIKRYVLIITVFFITIIMFSGCKEQNDSGFVYNPQDTVVPGDDLDSPVLSFSSDNYEDKSDRPEPLISIVPEQETIVDVININLDSDGLDEQIIAVNDKNDPSSTIIIKVIKYNQVLKRYSQVWFGETGSVSITNFDILTKDLTGDGQLEIICDGIDADGRYSYDIFKRLPRVDYLEYKNVFSSITEGTIEIEEYERSEVYYAGIFSASESFNIIQVSSDKSSANESDLKKTIYKWDPSKVAYNVYRTELIPGQEINDSKLKELLDKPDEEILNYLEGGWYNSKADYILFFNPVERSFSFFSGSDIQTFVWEERNIIHSRTYKINRYFFKSCYNELLRNLYLNIDLTITNLNELEIVIEDKQVSTAGSKFIKKYSGTYEKVKAGNNAEILDKFKIETIPELSGYYRSDSGYEINFEGSNFTLTDTKKEQTRSGGYAVYNVGYNVLDLRFLSIGRQQIGKETYKFVYQEEYVRGEVIRTLLLQPGTVGVFYFQRDDASTIKFEQREPIEPEEESQEPEE